MMELIEEETLWARAQELGLYLRGLWQYRGDRHSLNVEAVVISSLQVLVLKWPINIFYRTVMKYEACKNRFWSGITSYVLSAPKTLTFYASGKTVDLVFASLKKCNGAKKISLSLESPVCHSGFKRET